MECSADEVLLLSCKLCIDLDFHLPYVIPRAVSEQCNLRGTPHGEDLHASSLLGMHIESLHTFVLSMKPQRNLC